MTESNGILFGRVVLNFLILMLLAWPLVFIVNQTLSPVALTAVFGGYLTYWKSLGIVSVSRFIFGK